VELVGESGLSRGKRELEATDGDCEKMARALALSISIAIDQDSSPTGSTERAGTAPPAGAPATPHRLVAEDAPAKRPGREQPLPTSAGSRWSALAASAITLVGVAPRAAFGGALSYEWARGPAKVIGGARFASAPGGQVGAGAELSARLVAGELGLCWIQSVVEACAAGMAGANWLEGANLRSPRTSVGPFVALGTRALVAVPLSGAADMFAGGEAWGIATRVRAEVDGARVWSAPAFVPGVVIGARVRFF
jgi:hypothetical protein